MTKQKELELLEKIDALIKSADAGDYIPMTFAGIVEVCRRNIEDDFGGSPVEDCANMRVALDAEHRMHDETKRMLAEAQNMCAKAMDERDELRVKLKEAEEQRDCMAECVDGTNAILDQAEAEIRKLKAEIVRIRMERMTDVEYAELYDRMNEED